MNEQQEKEVIKLLIRFGRKNYRNVVAIHQGIDPEAETQEDEKRPVFYVIPQRKKFNSILEDRVTDVDLEIFKKTGVNVRISVWPCKPQYVSQYGFIDGTIYQVPSIKGIIKQVLSEYFGKIKSFF